MKLSELHALSDQKSSGILMMLALQQIRQNGARNVRGHAAPERFVPNRASMRAAKYSTSLYPATGHIYSGVVDAAEKARSGGVGITAEDKARRRAQGKAARRARATARKRG